MSERTHYFRARPGGALVFRIDPAMRMQRLEMEAIATVVTKTGQITMRGGRELTDADRKAINDWLLERRTVEAFRATDDVLRAIDTINGVADWAQRRASGDELEDVTDRLLIAMHDLRTVLVRKAADRIGS